MENILSTVKHAIFPKSLNDPIVLGPNKSMRKLPVHKAVQIQRLVVVPRTSNDSIVLDPNKSMHELPMFNLVQTNTPVMNRARRSQVQ